MKNLKSLLLATLMFALPLTATFAQSKVSHIDLSKLISELPEVIAANKQIKALEETYSNEIENTIKEFQSKYKEYEAQASTLSPVTQQARAAELQSMQQNIQTFQETASQDLQKKRAELLRPLYEKAVAAIDKVSKSLGFDYVLDTTQGLGVLVSNGTDISAEVKVELGF